MRTLTSHSTLFYYSFCYIFSVVISLNISFILVLYICKAVFDVLLFQMSNIQVGRFKWNNCDDKYYPMNFSSFSIQPDPVIPGEYIIASFILDVFEDIGTTNTLKVIFFVSCPIMFRSMIYVFFNISCVTFSMQYINY